jgi:hypothetical protein
MPTPTLTPLHHRADASMPDPALIAMQIDRDGFAVIDDYVAPEELKQAQEFVRQSVLEMAATIWRSQGPNGWAVPFCSAGRRIPRFWRCAAASTRAVWANPLRSLTSIRSCVASPASSRRPTR